MSRISASIAAFRLSLFFENFVGERTSFVGFQLAFNVVEFGREFCQSLMLRLPVRIKSGIRTLHRELLAMAMSILSAP